MSAWGNIYRFRTDVVGRIMSAIEQRADSIYDSSEWSSTRDQTDELSLEMPDEKHPSMLNTLEQEIKELVEGGKRK